MRDEDESQELKEITRMGKKSDEVTLNVVRMVVDVGREASSTRWPKH